MPLRLKPVCLKQSVVSIVLILTFACCGCEYASTVEPGGSTADADETDPVFRVPEGSPKAILKFVSQLLERKQNFPTNEQKLDDWTKTLKTLIRAADKILAQKTDDKSLAEATGLKIQAMTKLVLAMTQDDQVFESKAKEAIDFVSQLRHDKRPAVAKTADLFWVMTQSLGVGWLSAEERTALAAEVIKTASEKFSEHNLGEGYFVAEQFIRVGDFDQAASLLERLAVLASRAEMQELQSFAPQIKDRARFLRLGGKPIPIDGQLLNGREFDWESYRGKVVLLDFWATWCGPCLEEMKYVKACYEKYHKVGFDVVGISLDQDQRVLTDFLNSEQIPWPQLNNERADKDGIRRKSLAKEYGVLTIPRMIIVDRKGVVVSVEARGEELEPFVEKLLRPKE